MMAVFFFIAHEKGFQFHAQPQTGAYSCFQSSDLDFNSFETWGLREVGDSVQVNIC